MCPTGLVNWPTELESPAGARKRRKATVKIRYPQLPLIVFSILFLSLDFFHYLCYLAIKITQKRKSLPNLQRNKACRVALLLLKTNKLLFFKNSSKVTVAKAFY